VADHSHALRLFLQQLVDAPAKSGQHVLRRAHVEDDARHVRLVADALQPAVQHAERPIARKKARH